MGDKINAQFEVHSNESVCRKSECLGLYQVNCHKNNKQGLKYSLLLAKKAKVIPWDRSLVDILGL